MRDERGSIMDFKDFDWKNATHDDMISFAKTLDFPEPGITHNECRALIKALESTGGCPLTILETGMCYGTTTRIFIAWTLKYGGSVSSAEIVVRPLFEQKMKEAGYWQYVNVIGNSRYCDWPREKTLDFLFIDSEHALDDALGEYMRFRVYCKQYAVVGFHDYENCPGVTMAVDICSFVDCLEQVSASVKEGGTGLVLFKIAKHNWGGEYLSRQGRIQEEIKIAKDFLQQKV
jgi:hypothetical protein